MKIFEIVMNKVKKAVETVMVEIKKLTKPVVVAIVLAPVSTFAAGIDLSALVTKIDDQVPGLTGVGVSVTGLVIIVALFGLAFVLLRGR